MKRLLLLLSLLAASVAVSGGAGKPVRVVSLGPSITEIIYQLGKGDCLVGRSSACDYPAAALKVPVVGNFGGPFVERLAAVKPDYVLVTALKDKGARKTLESLGAKVLMLPVRTLEDYTISVKIIGEALGCPEAAAAEIARFNGAVAGFRAQAEKIPLERRPKVYLEVWHRPLQTCGGKTFINEMIECAGGVNIAAGEQREYFACSEEWILKRNPDIIISPGMGSGKSGQVSGRRGWGEIDAVKHNRIYTGLDQSSIFRLGPRTVDGIAIFKKCIMDGDTAIK